MSKPHPPPLRSHPKILKVQRKDNLFQRAEVLKRNREKRHQYGEFLVEGVAQINLAIRYQWNIRTLLFSTDRTLSSWAQELVSSRVAAEHWEMAPELMADLSDKDETSEILAIVEQKRLNPQAIPPQPGGLIVVFDRPASPGNLGSSIRSAEALGAHGIIISGHAVDMYDPFVVRGSMGALFALPVTTTASHTGVKEWVDDARAQGIEYQIIGSSGKATDLVCAVDFTKPTVLILGNETVGMSRGYWDICNTTVKIPIGGALSSINVSCAASILLYEVTRQRLVNP
jgi:tRNA G18 (ribose-2'-O)-methylase SpoU